MRKYFCIVLLSFLCQNELLAQFTDKQIILPSQANWNEVNEGELLNFSLKISGDSIHQVHNYQISQGKLAGMNIDSLGTFTWLPAYSIVARNEQLKLLQCIVEVRLGNGESISKTLDINVKHKNQKVVLQELKTFYLKFNSPNTYKIDKDKVSDDDDDPFVFIPNLETFPEGLNLSSSGEFTWTPSISQFKKVKENPIHIEFFIQDQPAKSQTLGKLKIEVTQLDLSPEINMVPKKDYYLLKENENVNLRFYLTDPNGEEDIEAFDMLSNLPNFDKKALIKNSANQYEFNWTPGYEFVQDPTDSLGFFIDFFVLDKTKKREIKKVYFTIKNTINEAETDKKNYELYAGTMARAWELMQQLKEKEEELKKSYASARKGKKQRSVLNASLGATTGLSSVLSKNKAETQRLISTIGGTTVLTIGTLEATEVIGKSMKDIIDRLNYVIEKKNELQTKGDIYARDFSLKSSRRNADYLRKTDDFMAVMNLKGLVALELSASWESKTKLSDNNIKKIYKDFVAW